MKTAFLLTSLALMNIALGQKVIDVSKQTGNVIGEVFFVVGGNPFVTAKFVNMIEGSPYYVDEWHTGNIVMPLGKEFKGLSLKLDLYDNELHYKNEKDQEYIATNQVKELTIIDDLGGTHRFVHSSAFTPTNNTLKNRWLLSLQAGDVSLYKLFTKTVSESKPYGSATVEQRMITKESYLVAANNSLLEIKKIRDAPTVLANKQKELEEFLKTKDDKNLTMDERLKALIVYYNSLFKKE